MRGGGHYYPGVQVAAWNVTEDKLYHRFFSANFLKLITILSYSSDNCIQLPLELPRPLRANTSPKKNKVFLNVMLLNIMLNLWCTSQNTFSPNHGLNFFDNLHLFRISPSLRIQGLGIVITVLYPNHLSRT